MGEKPYQSGFVVSSLTWLLLSGDGETDGARQSGQVRVTPESAQVRAKWQSAEFITFSFPKPDQLRIVISNTPTGELLSRTVDAREYTCERGSVTIRRARWAGRVAPQFVPVVTRESVFLDLYPLDADLIVRQRTNTAGVVAVIPFRNTQSTWYRFARVGDD